MVYPNRNRGRTARGGRRPNRNNQISNLPARAPSGFAPSNIPHQPALYPRICIARTVSGIYDLVSDGINPTYVGLNFSLNDIPGLADMTGMYQTYCIEQVEIWFRPEYTVLSDASALSNSVNVDLYSAIDLTDSSAPGAVADIQQYQNCAHTSIVTTHYRKIKPAYAASGGAPMCLLVPTSNNTLNWNSLRVAIPPTGVAMTFRSIAKFKIALVGLK